MEIYPVAKCMYVGFVLQMYVMSYELGLNRIFMAYVSSWTAPKAALFRRIFLCTWE